MTCTLTSRSDAASVVARSGYAEVVPGLLGLVIGFGTVESR